MKEELIRVAQEEAKRNYHGATSDSVGNLQPLAEYFAEEDIPEEAFDADWSGAFAYRCAVLAGFSMPPRYPDTRVHAGFWRVASWYEYARLPKIRLWHCAAEPIEAGDLAILTVPEGTPDLIGIVTAVRGDVLELALGNYHGHSACIERPLTDLFGFIRLK